MLFKRRKRKLGSEDRRYYRVSPRRKQSLTVVIKPEEGTRITGELVDISSGGVAVTFPLKSDPELDIDAPVEVFVSSASQELISAPAAVASRTTKERKHVRYGFEFLDPARLLEIANPETAPLLNRRCDLRVRPALGTQLVATVHCSATKSFQVDVYDLSARGIGFIVTELQAGIMAPFSSFGIELQIPHSQTEIHWRAVVLHHSNLPRGGVLYGLIFDQDGEPSFEEEREQVVEYCAERAADMARWDLA